MPKSKALVTDKKVLEKIRRGLALHYPDAKTSLNFINPYQLFVATVLSAQTTDRQVNNITAGLFKAFPEIEDLASAEPDELEPYLKSCGLYRHKSRFLVESSRMILEQFDGIIPDQLEELVKLPGVGRKTANVIISSAFGKPSLAVDTHVYRVSKRIGLADAANVTEVEEQLKKVFPKSEWTVTHHRLIRHGREICHARKPDCPGCFLNTSCLYVKERGIN